MNESQLESHYAEAEACLARNDAARAIDIYSRLCVSDPRNSEPWFMMGLILAEQGESSRAEAHLRRAIELEPSHPDAHLNLAHQLLAAGNANAAEKHCAIALEHDPEFAEAWTFRSGIQASKGEFEQAIASVRRAVALDPELAAAWAQLARLEFQRGHSEAAIEASRRALIRNPADRDSQKLLGLLLVREGRGSEAKSIFETVLKASPDDVEALRGLGHAWLLAGDADKAPEHFSRSLELDPDSTATWLTLSRIHGSRQAFDKAAECAKRAVSLTDTDAAARTQLADMLKAMGQFEVALEQYNSALHLAPEYPDALTGRAELFERMGRHQEARRDLQPLLESRHISRSALLAYASVAPHVGETAHAVARLEAAAGQLHEGQGQQLHHRLGHLYALMEHYDQAFSHYTIANNLRGSDYDAEAVERLVDWIIGEYSEQALRAAPRSRQETELPLFLVGMPRSGTTLVEQIIASHPQARGGGELQELPQIAAALASNAERDLLRPPAVARLDAERLDQASSIYLERVAPLAGGATRLTDKMLFNVFHLGLIATLFPHARVIHCVRNPLDTCLSNFFQNYSGYRGFATELTHTGHFYLQLKRLMDHWHGALGLPILTVRYEDLVANQEDRTRDILNFCGLPWDASCLAFHENPRVANTASYNQIRQPMYATSVTRWRHYENHLAPLRRSLNLD